MLKRNVCDVNLGVVTISIRTGSLSAPDVNSTDSVEKIGIAILHTYYNAVSLCDDLEWMS